ncbi:MAG: helix-turn-helix domain-containing protein [Nanoarchaeota archaeon]|nr:helix-turn-helix domain-containing protein [Nanoarchaeota archaeon]
MKLSNYSEKRIFRDIWLVVTILAGFIFVVSFISHYVSNVINQGMACTCIVPIPMMILFLSSLGVFVGSLSYYLLSSKFIKERKVHTQDVNLTLKFLNYDERTVIEALIKSNGGINQSRLIEETGINKVKTSRLLVRLINKGIITKKVVGKINKIYLHEDLINLFQ